MKRAALAACVILGALLLAFWPASPDPNALRLMKDRQKAYLDSENDDGKSYNIPHFVRDLDAIDSSKCPKDLEGAWQEYVRSWDLYWERRQRAGRRAAGGALMGVAAKGAVLLALGQPHLAAAQALHVPPVTLPPVRKGTEDQWDAVKQLAIKYHVPIPANTPDF